MARIDDTLLVDIQRGATDFKFSPADAVTMVVLLARRRRRVTDKPYAEALEFGGKVLCFVFDPVKSRNTASVEAMRDVRELFRGIFADPELQDRFESSLSKDFLQSETVADAIERGGDLFFVEGKYTRGA